MNPKQWLKINNTKAHYESSEYWVQTQDTKISQVDNFSLKNIKYQSDADFEITKDTVRKWQSLSSTGFYIQPYYALQIRNRLFQICEGVPFSQSSTRRYSLQRKE